MNDDIKKAIQPQEAQFKKWMSKRIEVNGLASSVEAYKVNFWEYWKNNLAQRSTNGKNDKWKYENNWSNLK